MSLEEEAVSDDYNSDEEDSDDNELKDYLKAQVFENFKAEVYQLISLKEQDIIALRSEQAAFLAENLRLLESVDKIDWSVMRKAETLTTDTLA